MWGNEVLFRWCPAVRKQFVDAVGRLRRQPVQDVLQVRVDIMAVEPSRMDQAHHRCGTLPGAQTTCEQPVISSMWISTYVERIGCSPGPSLAPDRSASCKACSSRAACTILIPTTTSLMSSSVSVSTRHRRSTNSSRESGSTASHRTRCAPIYIIPPVKTTTPLTDRLHSIV
jgi:hypothetical protein